MLSLLGIAFGNFRNIALIAIKKKRDSEKNKVTVLTFLQ